MKPSHTLAALGLAVTGLVIVGCSGGDDNRTVTKEEVQAADAKRQQTIDSLNLPQATKDAMKAHMGGPPVSDPVAAAKAAASASPDRRR